ncbi:MAG TPA: hypothetical protein VGA37_05420 [Gemmatimonadales bacterium]
MRADLERDVRFLKAYAVGTTIVAGVLIASAFGFQDRNPRFDEIDVERVNIVERDGTLRMVISNQERQHPGIVNGKVIPRRGPRPPGMLFFNHLGDEMGGLIFGENGGDGHFGSLTFDKVRNDQTIGLRHLEGDNGAYSAGLEVWQQPNLPADVVQARYEAAQGLPDEAARRAAVQAMRDNGELTTQRLFLGKLRDNAALLQMSDLSGKPRIRIVVTADGTATLEFLDASGQVVYALPEQR